MGQLARRIVAIVIAVLFSLLYAGLYPVLTGRSAVYWYPYWPPARAAAYVAGGILLQGWFCYRGGAPVTPWSLVAQILTGLGYGLAATLVPGSLYQS